MVTLKPPSWLSEKWHIKWARNYFYCLSHSCKTCMCGGEQQLDEVLKRRTVSLLVPVKIFQTHLSFDSSLTKKIKRLWGNLDAWMLLQWEEAQLPSRHGILGSAVPVWASHCSSNSSLWQPFSLLHSRMSIRNSSSMSLQKRIKWTNILFVGTLCG